MITEWFQEADPGHPPDNLAERLTVCAKDLMQSCSDVEPEFTRLGRELESIHTHAKDLLDCSTQAVDNLGDISGDSILKRVVKSVEIALDHLKDSISVMDRRLEIVKEITHRLIRLYRHVPVLLRIAKSLKMVALNINIEASRFEDAKALFFEFGTEIKALSNKVAAVGHTIREDAGAAIEKQTGFEDRGMQDLVHLTGLAGGVRQELSHATSALEAILALCATAFKNSETHSKAISHQVSEIVLGVQIHDRVSQQMEHIVSSLKEAKALCAAGTDPGGDDPQQGYGAAHAIVDLQARQLGQVIDTIDAVQAKITGAFERLEGVVQENAQSLECTDSLCLQNEAGRRMDKNPMHAFKTTLEHIDTLLGQGSRLLSQLNTAAEETAGSVTRVSGHLARIRGISFEIHLKALNAIVSTTHIGGRGKTIAVLVQEMKAQSNQSSGFVSEVEQIIKDIHVSVKETKVKDALESQKDAEVDYRLESELEEIENITRTSEQERETLYRLGSELNGRIVGVKNGLSFLGAFSEILAQHLVALNEIKETLSPWAGHIKKDLSAEADQLSNRYTMQEERGIHEAFFNGDGSVQTAEALPKVEEPSDAAPIEDADSLGDNVELF